MTYASFGYKNETLIDPKVRCGKAVSIMTHGFAVDRQLIAIGTNIVFNTLGANYYAMPYKMNVYGSGDFFEIHTDTPSEDLEYTLIVYARSTYTRGDLCFVDQKFNFPAQLPEDPQDLSFILFPIDCPHKVEVVASGITICYIFS